VVGHHLGKLGGCSLRTSRRRCWTTGKHRITQREIKCSRQRCARVTNASPSERAMHGGKWLSPTARTCLHFACCDWRTYRTCRTLFCAAWLQGRASANPRCVIRGSCPAFAEAPISCCAAPGRLKQSSNTIPLTSDTPFCRLQSRSGLRLFCFSGRLGL
jgi:hypothetical protein